MVHPGHREKFEKLKEEQKPPAQYPLEKLPPQGPTEGIEEEPGNDKKNPNEVNHEVNFIVSSVTDII
ncbi:MAG: hypothetical protein ABII07_01475 [Patescibacteria group bacterium]|nr:hypothetical protein [Patescibacteria group bacterium]